MGADGDLKRFSKYQAEWETNARFDAKWAVLALGDKIGYGWDEKDFFQTGVSEVNEVFAFLDRSGIDLPHRSTCLDFGCGVGRITQALAPRFAEVIGVDISQSMLEQANSYPRKAANTTYVFSGTPDLERTFGCDRFDLVYTNITLQHLNNELQRHYIDQFAKIVKPGGLAIFQIPSQAPKRVSGSAAKRILLGAVRPGDAWSLISTSFRNGVFPWRVRMELNTLPEVEVQEVAEAAGLKLLRKAYIDWDEFFRTHNFVLLERPDRVSAHFAVSTMYFFQLSAGNL